MSTRVLLVDKHSAAAQRVAEQLVDFGCHVRVTGDGAQALKELEANPYDLVLAEMGASPVRSLNLARTIRQNHPGTRVIVTAGNGGSLWPPGPQPGGLEMLFDAPEPRRLLDLLSTRPGPRGAILLVDDHLEEMSGMRELLTAEGYTVLTASSGEAALEIARRGKVRAAVIDFKMPGMSGWDTYKALKDIDPDIHAVIITGCSLDDYVHNCFKADDVPVINKTFDPREMFWLVNASLRARGEPLGETLLLVDDDAMIREDLADYLRIAGFLVQTAASGEAAAALAREVAFDMAIVDYLLPDMTGLELVENLRANRFDAEVVILTGHPDVDSAMQAVNLKVHEYLSKPVLPEKLLDSLHRALRQRRLQRQVRGLAHDLYHANQKLEDLDRMKSRFLFIVAHDIRSPLSAVKGFAQFLLKELGGPAAGLKHGLESILRGAVNIGRLVEDLLDLGRMESGKLAVHLQDVALGPLLDGLRDRLENAARETGMELACDFSRAPARVEADPLRLEQIVSNLVGNALKHARKGKRAELTVAAEGDVLEVSVRDRGPGMTREVIAHLFEPYYQGTDDALGAGIGLGLSIVKELVEGHHGTIRAESPGPGLGSAFLVTLPLRARGGGTGGKT